MPRMDTATRPAPIAPANGSFVCVCVDPAAAADYGQLAYVTDGDIVATAAQWEIITRVGFVFDARPVTASATDIDGAWRITFVDDEGRDGAFGRIFDRVGIITVDADGDVTDAEWADGIDDAMIEAAIA